MIDILTAIKLGLDAAEFIAAEFFDDDEVTPQARQAAENLVLALRIIDAISRGHPVKQEWVTQLEAESYKSNADLNAELQRRRAAEGIDDGGE